MRRRTLLFAAVTLSACVRAPVATSPQPVDPNALPPPVERTLQEAQSVVRAQDEALWRSWIDGTPLELSKAHAGHEALFSLETYRTVDQALSQARSLKASPSRIRELEQLRAFLAGEYLARGLAEINAVIANLEASMTFTVAGLEQRFHELPKLLANEKSAVRRRALYSGASESYERLGQSIRRKEERTFALISELGFGSYEACAAALHNAEPASFLELAAFVLDGTDAVYGFTLERLAREELALPIGNLSRADLPRAFRGPSEDEGFSSSELLPRARATFGGMGVVLDNVPGLTLDVTDSPKKSSRPLTVAPAIPGDVRISIRLRSGVQSQASLLHELGHSLSYSFTRPLPFALSRLGSPATPEAFAVLFEELAQEPLWLEKIAGVRPERANAVSRALASRRLFLMRRAAGRLNYGYAVRASPEGELGALYEQHLGRAYGIAGKADDQARRLAELEDFFTSADDLRAWILAGQLRKQLVQRFGEAWWAQLKAGEWLKSLWAEGNARSPEELARAIGEPGLDASAAVERLSTALKR